MVAGCGQLPVLMSNHQPRADGFYPHSIVINKSFTRIVKGSNHTPSQTAAISANTTAKGKNTRSGNGEYIDTYVQIKDQYGDAIKALGVFRVEVYKYISAASRLSGGRFAVNGIQKIDLTNVKENMKLWDRVTQSYHLHVKLPPLPYAARAVVMEVTFIAKSGRKRLESSVIINTAK